MNAKLKNLSLASSPGGGGSEPDTDVHCFQSLYHKDHSVLSLAATEDYIFCGTQGSCIHVWGAQDFLPRTVLRGHMGSVFALALDTAHHTLYSGSGDGTVRAWNTETLTCQFVLHSGPNVGDILSLAYCVEFDTLFMGCQNTSIQWFSPSATDASPKSSGELESISHNSKFFDSATSQTFALDLDPSVEHYMVYDQNIQPHSHYGHVYALTLGTLPNSDAVVLFSGSGDGQAKLWTVQADGIRPLRSLKGEIANIFSMTLSEGLLFCGCQDGAIKIWDLETYHLMWVLKAHADDVLSLTSNHQHLVSASADGTIKIWDKNFECLHTLAAHEGIILAMITANGYLVSGGSDQVVKFWDIPSHIATVPPSPLPPLYRHAMLATLERWVTYPSISGNPRYQQDCRRAARFLKTLMEQLGAESYLVPGAYGHNPLVFGKFMVSSHTSPLHSPTQDPPPSPAAPTVLVYGHYDVFSVDEDLWDSPPFQMSGRNGYIYGRGVTDDKGPILAMLYAVHELLQERSLPVNVCFLIEGEEENGSIGLKEAVASVREAVGRPDVVLLSNSYWMGEELPCLTYGLRGSIQATVNVVGKRQQDVHSGVSGGAVTEPLQIMLKLLSNLADSDGKVTSIPGFQADVLPVSDQEKQYYQEIIHRTGAESPSVEQAQQRIQGLMSRWRYPALTVHKIEVSGPHNNDSIIPHTAQASVSMRIVPNQSMEDITRLFTNHLEILFAAQKTDCELKIEIRKQANWWLGDTANRYFKAAEKAVEKHWGTKPIYIREGGTIGSVPWLESFFGASAVNIPLGQSSDQAHLCNERIRLKNLLVGKDVIKDFFRSFGDTI
ncbi:hypothetical protein H4R35_005791 [Dimargaris xerosporica]|nr:hypothetical protein H4R35_005791 [Dimargaris xerosporica]